MRKAWSPPGLRTLCTAAPRGSGWAGTGGWAAGRSWGCWRCGWGSRASCGALGSSGTRPELTGQTPVVVLHLKGVTLGLFLSVVNIEGKF